MQHSWPCHECRIKEHLISCVFKENAKLQKTYLKRVYQKANQ